MAADARDPVDALAADARDPVDALAADARDPVDALAARLATRARAAGAPAGHPARPAATLLLLAPGADGWELVFTRRPQSLRQHAGQVSFPGGQRGDDDADAAACALREAGEELGLDPAAVAIVGLLDDVVTPTGFLVTPVVGRLRRPVVFTPSPVEVAEVFTVALAALRAPLVYRGSGALRHEGVDYTLHEYHLDGRVIWGATARMLHQLLRLWPG